MDGFIFISSWICSSLFIHRWIHFFLHSCAHLSWMGTSLFLHGFVHLYFFIDLFIFISSLMDSSLFLHRCAHLSWIWSSSFLHRWIILFLYRDAHFHEWVHLYFFMNLFIFISSLMDSSLFLHQWIHLYFFIDGFIYNSS